MRTQAVWERSLSACTNVQKSYLFVSELKFRNRIFHLRYQLSMTEAVEYFTHVYRVIASRLREKLSLSARSCEFFFSRLSVLC